MSFARNPSAWLILLLVWLSITVEVSPLSFQEKKEAVEASQVDLAETSAFEALKAMEVGKEQLNRARQYLKDYPQSPFTPSVHRLLAINYYQLQKKDEFFEHSLLALAEMPSDLWLLAHMARQYAREKEYEKAIDFGVKAVGVSAPPPPGFAEGDWYREITLLKSAALYSMGLSQVEQYVSRKPEDKAYLRAAIRNLEAALRLDPDFAYAHYRLARAYLRDDDGENALKHYARAVAADESNKEFRREMHRIYVGLKGGVEGMEELIGQEGENLRTERRRILKKVEELNTGSRTQSESPS